MARLVLLVAAAGIVADVVSDVLESIGDEVDRSGAASAAEVWGRRGHDLAIVLTDELAEPRPTLHELGLAGARVLALTEQPGSGVARALLRQEAFSVITYRTPPDLLLSTVAVVAGGACVLENAAATSILAEWRRSVGAQDCGATGSGADLTPREFDVLRALAAGLASKGVARRLGISLKTVESHKANLFKKLGVRTQAQAVAVAIQAGFVEDSGAAEAGSQSEPPGRSQLP